MIVEESKQEPKANQGLSSEYEELFLESQEMALKAEQFYKEKNFITAKTLLVQSCDNLLKLLKIQPQNLVVKGLFSKLLMQAEECKNALAALYKINENDPAFQVIKETILDNKMNVTFKDLAGLEDIKETINEILILPSLRPDLFTGIRAPPRGILMYGPPGNGKTFLAKAIANEAKATFFNLSASTLVSKYMGDSEKIMRALFAFALSKQPSVIFIDEIDSILTSRSENEHEASRRLKTEFLLQFDGVGTSDQEKITLIGATNRPHEIDSAALRRFTKRIFIGPPTEQSIKSLINQLLKDVKHKLSAAELKHVAQQLKGYSCSDIKAVIKEASIEPLRGLKKNELLEVKADKIRALNKEDILKAISNVPPSLSAKDMKIYIDFEKKYSNNNF